MNITYDFVVHSKKYKDKILCIIDNYRNFAKKYDILNVKFYAITYDLRQPGRKYNDLYDAIKTTSGDGNWQHPMESFWIVAFGELSDWDANKIFDTLRTHIDANDSIMVNKVEFVDYQGWMPKSLWDWINEKKNVL